ncbi:putative [ribosomal protein S18]-alanine N-acetyltransferase [Rhodamnia argentea]|uniref:[ribosomal protein S18]-alanine N-acetyltransferase n=1 Tax=Rhodamnia argentea TaxID=178133 RepID=A0A8B8QGN2_9MYRT|nr:putative [ribosomal protein S18]-alanine N-acetyltransferase [Rhodamnia argentea]
MAAKVEILELKRNSHPNNNWDKILNEVVKMEKKLFPKHESLARSFEEELRKKNTGLLYLELDGEVAGYVMYTWPSSLCASITKLAVKESCQRQGHGGSLLRAAIQKCRERKVQRVSLHVDPLRAPAVHLYKKLGFQVDALIRGYYSSDRDAYRMFLDFDAD